MSKAAIRGVLEMLYSGPSCSRSTKHVKLHAQVAETHSHTCGCCGGLPRTNPTGTKDPGWFTDELTRYGSAGRQGTTAVLLRPLEVALKDSVKKTPFAGLSFTHTPGQSFGGRGKRPEVYSGPPYLWLHSCIFS